MCEACAASHTITYGYQPHHAVKEETSSDIMIFTFITFLYYKPRNATGSSPFGIPGLFILSGPNLKQAEFIAWI
jgi:hypothetical protein